MQTHESELVDGFRKLSKRDQVILIILLRALVEQTQQVQ